jgi:hypothetical protein
LVVSIFFCNFAASKHLNIEVMNTEFNNFKNVLSDGTEVVTLGVTSEQNDIAIKILEGGFSRRFGNYTLEEADADMVEDWLEEAENDTEPDTEYIDYMARAIEEDADVYTLEDWLGEFHQPIGEVIVF